MKWLPGVLLSAILVGHVSGSLSPYDIGAPRLGDGLSPLIGRGLADLYFDDVESLSAGPLDGQTNAMGQTWTGLDAVVVSDGGNQYVSQTNIYADDYFYPEVATTLPHISTWFGLSVDVALSDLATDRFFTPVDNFLGQVFTRVGDADGDGDWDVLQLDPGGTPYFADTGAAIPLAFHLEIRVNSPDLWVFVNHQTVFHGHVIDTTLFGGPGASSVLTSVEFESANNSDGAGSLATYDNLGIRIPEPATLLLLVVGGLALIRRR